MKKFLYTLCGLVAGVIVAGHVASAQGSLSTQVLQLLSRSNTWTGVNTWVDVRLPIASIPSDTSARLYSDLSGNLYYNGSQISNASGGVTPHNILSPSHGDTLTASVTRGAVIIGNSTPAWSKLSLCTNGQFIGSNGTDTICTANGSGLTTLTAGNLTGTASAFDGNAITNLNATNIGTGTVPLARLSNIANAQIAAAAAIAYSKLALTASVVNADIAGGAAIAYSKLALTGSIVTGDLTAATLLFDRFATNGASSGQVVYYNGAAWVARTLVPGDLTGGGTVTSAAMTVPGALLSVSGSPITTSGTFAVTLPTQTANLIFAGPGSAGPSSPTFRSLVNADLPLSGVGAGSYAKVTVNTAGVVTAASTQASLTADVSGILPFANGGTGLSTAADDTVMISSGSGWVAQTLPNCTTALAYTQATNLFSCSSTASSHNLLSSSHTDTLAGTVARGDIVIGNSTPAWARKAVGTAGQIISTDGVDVNWVNTIARGIIAANTPWDWTQTWNNGGVTFAGFRVSITPTASASDSILFQVRNQIASPSADGADFRILRDGTLILAYFGNSATLWVSHGIPTISAGFGTTPSIVGIDTTFRVTQGTPVGTTGTVTFGKTYNNPPVCTGVDETTTAGNPLKLTPTTTTVAVASGGTMVAADKIAISCFGF